MMRSNKNINIFDEYLKAYDKIGVRMMRELLVFEAIRKNIEFEILTLEFLAENLGVSQNSLKKTLYTLDGSRDLKDLGRYLIRFGPSEKTNGKQHEITLTAKGKRLVRKLESLDNKLS